MDNLMLQLEPFALERYFAEYEFSVRYNMGPSDCETMTAGELLALGGPGAEGALAALPLGYTESSGSMALRSAVAGLYTGISPEDVFIAAPQECIFVFLMGFLPRGGHVIVMTPAYQSLLSIPQAAGCEVSSLPVREDGSGWTFDMDALRREIKPNTRCIIVNTPHNPTGLVLTDGMRKDLADTARKHGITVFCDEMYRGLEYGLGKTPPSLCEEYEDAVCLSGLSKAYGLPGLRIGWLVTRNRSRLEAAAAMKDYTTICNSAPGELLAETAVRHTAAITDKTLGIVRQNLTAVESLFRQFPELLIMKQGTGGSTLFPRFRRGISSEDLAARLVKAKNTLLVHGPLFDMAPEYFRIGLGRENLPEVLGQFAAFLEEEYGGP